LSHTITISSDLSKEEKYKSLIPQIQSLVSDEKDLIANLANICAALKYNMDGFFWVGFYFVKGSNLVVGPYQGPLACTRFKIGESVCGNAVKERKTIIVDDVNKFPGHIACSPDSKSEIVVPIYKNNEVYAVLDIDSDSYSNFDDTDKKYLELLAELITELI
jgi:L-methionine (R)-S-oxide reductase